MNYLRVDEYSRLRASIAAVRVLLFKWSMLVYIIFAATNVHAVCRSFYPDIN